ncbi:uncharacterized protein LOC143630520 [Bidens hawaiensis]|uniref:uncharacterized protein LOC143630520 n=1 Tax=Bidens hawaiensis TaxID=980011 RepID=UPI0040499916
MGRPSTDVEETILFAKWLLDIGEGNVGDPNDGVATIDIPDDMLIKDSVDPISKLFDFDRAILASTNEIVDEINDSLLKFFHPKLLNGLRVYGLPNYKLVLEFGVTVMLFRNLNQKEGLCNGTRLHIISLGTCLVEAKIISPTNIGHRVHGLPNYKLMLEDGVPVMLLRNLKQKEGLCNGTRLHIISLGTCLVEAKIIS